MACELPYVAVWQVRSTANCYIRILLLYFYGRGQQTVQRIFGEVGCPVAINVKTGMLPFGILANHNIKMCHNSTKKNNDTKDYSEQLEFLNSEPYYASKKIVNQSSDFPVRRTC